MGLSEPEAIQQYGEENIKVYNSTFTAMYTALTSHRQATTMKLICAGENEQVVGIHGIGYTCLLYTSPSPRDQRGSRMPSSA